MRHPLLCLALLIAGGAAAQTPVSHDSAMGVWPWLVKNINSDIPKIVADTKAMGMDHIYISVFRVMGRLQGSLPVDDESGRWNPAWGAVNSYATLSAFIGQARAAGLQVIGVMSCFKPGVVEPDDLAHQKWLAEEVLGYFFDHFRTNGRPWYELDGMCFDYVRYGSGANHTSKDVNDFLDRVRARHPWLPLHAYVIANAYSFDGPTYDNVFRSYNDTIAMITRDFGQNYEEMARRLDAILPMAYVANGGVYGTNVPRMKGYVKKVAEYVRRAMTAGGSPSTPVIVAIQTYGSADSNTVDASASGAMEGGAHGFMPFRYYTCDPSWFPVMGKHIQPGTNRPVAELAAAAQGQSLALDPTASRDGQDPVAGLTVRYDYDGDGRLDTPLLAMGRSDRLAPAPGTRVVGVQVGDSEGHWARARRQVYVADSLRTAFPMLSVAAGGRIDLPCTAGPGGAGRFHVALATLSGTTPGLPLAPGVTVPLNYDIMTWTSLLLANSAVFPGTVGTVPAGGSFTPAFHPGSGLLPAALAGGKVHFAVAFFHPATFAVEGASNAALLHLVP